MPSILEQLGVNIPPMPDAGVAGGSGVTPEGSPAQAMPMAEAKSTAGLGNLRDIGESIVAGAILALEQVIPAFGITSEEGKAILKAVDMLSKVVSEEKINEVQTMMTVGIQASPTPTTTPTPTPTTGGTGTLPPELENLMKGGR